MAKQQYLFGVKVEKIDGTPQKKKPHPDENIYWWNLYPHPRESYSKNRWRWFDFDSDAKPKNVITGLQSKDIMDVLSKNYTANEIKQIRMGTGWVIETVDVPNFAPEYVPKNLLGIGYDYRTICASFNIEEEKVKCDEGDMICWEVGTDDSREDTHDSRETRKKRYDEFKLEIGDLIEVSSKVSLIPDDDGNIVRIWQRARVKEHHTITCGGTTYCDDDWKQMEKIKVAENWSNPNQKFEYEGVDGEKGGKEYTARGVRAHIFDDADGDDELRVYTEEEEAKRMHDKFPTSDLPGNLFRRFKIESTATPEVSRAQLTSDYWSGKYYTAEERHWFIERWENPDSPESLID